MMSFNSLQTGRHRQQIPLCTKCLGRLVSIPFKREGTFRQAHDRRTSNIGARLKRFNSLQTGRHIQTVSC